MKKIYFALIAAVVLLSSCSSQPDTTPLMSDRIDAEQKPVTTVEIKSGEIESRKNEVAQLVTDYIDRVYNIDYKDYSPEYIDETTTAEEMKEIVEKYKIKCAVKNQLTAEMEFTNASSAEVMVVLTADYESTTVEPDEYYIPLSIDCIVKDDAWIVKESEFSELFPTSEFDVVKNDVSGYYEVSAKKGVAGNGEAQ